jgi:hypothetical protein
MDFRPGPLTVQAAQELTRLARATEGLAGLNVVAPLELIGNVLRLKAPLGGGGALDTGKVDENATVTGALSGVTRLLVYGDSADGYGPLSLDDGTAVGLIPVAGTAVLSITPASATQPGFVTTYEQTFAGNKTFDGIVTAPEFDGTFFGPTHIVELESGGAPGNLQFHAPAPGGGNMNLSTFGPIDYGYGAGNHGLIQAEDPLLGIDIQTPHLYLNGVELGGPIDGGTW